MQNDHEKFQQYWAQFSAELNLDNKQVEELYSLRKHPLNAIAKF